MTEPLRLTAATVLHNPDPVLLAALCDALSPSSTPLFAFCNSPIDDKTRAELESRAGVTLLGDGANGGLGAALNGAMAAAETAGFTHVLLLDQDSTPDAALPSILFERAGALAGALGAIGPRLEPPAGQGYKPVWYSFRRGGRPGARPVDFLPTSGSLMPVAAWRAVGPFRNDFFIDGIDVEWSFRAWASGRQMLLADDLVMRHRWGRPSESSLRAQILRQGPLRNAYYLRNAVYSLRLPHPPLRWKARSAVRLAAQTLLLCVTGEGANALTAIRSGWRGALGPLN